MTATLLTTLFALGALSALGAIWSTFQRYGRSALALRAAIRSCETTRTLRFAIMETSVQKHANVIRPVFAPEFTRPRPFRSTEVPQRAAA